MDLDLMDRCGQTYEHARGPGYNGYARFFLIGSDGQDLGEVKPYDILSQKFRLCHPSTWARQEVAGETVWEALQKLGDVSRVRCVLEIRDNWGIEVVLHKVPAGRPLQDWLAQIKEVAERELSSELNKINRA